VLRQRSRQRRLVWITAAAAAVLIMLVSGVLLLKHHNAPEDVPGVRSPVAVDTPLPDTLATDAPAADIERVGEISSPGHRAVLYRRAGDRYLDDADPQDALRCYTQALDDGSEADLQVSAEDSWLLMALKIDRNKEKKNANRD
jgi:hypothetical protein